MSIDWRVRAKSPVFWLGIAGAAATPMLAHLGLGYEDMTTWGGVGEVLVKFVGSPYLIGLTAASVLASLGVVVDPTTPGAGDSERALGYGAPPGRHAEDKGK